MSAKAKARTPLTAPRKVALAVMRLVRDGDLADRSLDRAAEGLAVRERAWTQELVYGTLRLRGRLDFLLSQHAREGLASLDPDVVDVLRLGAYQLLEMGSVPAYAAISQSQELVRAAGAPWASGLVAGILHSVERAQPEAQFPSWHENPLDHLVTYGSHPRWLLERWFDRWPAAEVRALVEANNRVPESYLRPLGLSAPAAVVHLRKKGIESEAVDAAPSVRLAAGADIGEALATVPAVVQDPAAALVVQFAAVAGRTRVLDLCAAPGGKTLGLAEDGRYVVAADVSSRRLARLRENVQRMGATERIGVVAADALSPPFRLADAVLLDVPCTGTGTLRRHPDGRWRVAPDSLAALAGLQAELLESAAHLVRPGGILVYATCSLEPEENELQVESFLTRRAEFERAQPPQLARPSLIDSAGDLRVLPQQTGWDGSYAARLRRKP